MVVGGDWGAGYTRRGHHDGASKKRQSPLQQSQIACIKNIIWLYQKERRIPRQKQQLSLQSSWYLAGRFPDSYELGGPIQKDE